MKLFDSRMRLVLGLALRDFRHERLMSICSVLAVGAILLPLLILFGIRFGIISSLLTPLMEDPRYRQILPAGSGHYEPDWFDAMGRRADVEFIVPRTRSIAATMRLRMPDSDVGRIVDVELIPSAAGDPVLGDASAPAGFEHVTLSLDAADKLGARAGARIEGILSRVYQGEQETVILPLQVDGVASAGAFARDGMFVSRRFIVAVEDFLDGRAVPELGWDGTPASDAPRSFAGFRLYARSLDDVAGLRKALMDRGVDVRTRLADIELVHKLDRNLGIAFWVIAVIAAIGYGLSFGSSVWASVDRKRREYSTLRLAGFKTRDIVWFPIVQAALTGALGWAIAAIGFFGVQAGLNVLFADTIGGGQAICRLLPWHFVAALALTLLTALAAAASGGWRVAKLEPSLALREI